MGGNLTTLFFLLATEACPILKEGGIIYGKERFSYYRGDVLSNVWNSFHGHHLDVCETNHNTV